MKNGRFNCNSRYGNHGTGFMLSMLAGFTLEGLCWVCAAQAYGLAIPLVGLGAADAKEL